MEKAFLENCLAEGLSLEAIGKRVERHPSTVGYWLKKHGLSATRARQHTPKGPPDRAELEVLLCDGLTLREIGSRVERSMTTVRYWIGRYGLRTGRRPRRKRLADGPREVELECRRHGKTTFVLEGRGYYRCGACRVEGVSRRRRAVKARLVLDAGGSCVVCGYARSQQGLQFHHLDPATKEFHLGGAGFTRSLAKSRAEARKCVLLCANCHAEVEAGLIEVSAKTELPVNSVEDQSEVAHSA